MGLMRDPNSAAVEHCFGITVLWRVCDAAPSKTTCAGRQLEQLRYIYHRNIRDTLSGCVTCFLTRAHITQKVVFSTTDYCEVLLL